MSLRATGTVVPLTCPSCGSRMKADDINVELLIGICRGCDSTVELAKDGLPGPRSPEEPRAIAVRDSVPEELMALSAAPPGLTVVRQDSELEITRSWFALDGQFFVMALFCFVWDGFLLVWYAAGLGALIAGEASALLMLAFPVLHVAAGAFLTYSLVARLVNKTRVVVSAGHITVTHGPLPWSEPQPVPTGSVDQLYLVQKTNKNTRSFALVARHKDMTSTELLAGLDSDVQVRFLERRIESWLGIDDVAVDGEYTG